MVVDLGKLDQLMLEVVIHLQLIQLKELMADRVQEVLVMQEAEAEEHLQLVLLPHNQVVILVELQQLVVEMVEMGQTELEATDVLKKAVVVVPEQEENSLVVEMVDLV